MMLKELLEMRKEEARERRRQQNSVRHVLLALNIIRANFPEATRYVPEVPA
jgi:hypothetical protein